MPKGKVRKKVYIYTSYPISYAVNTRSLRDDIEDFECCEDKEVFRSARTVIRQAVSNYVGHLRGSASENLTATQRYSRVQKLVVAAGNLLSAIEGKNDKRRNIWYPKFSKRLYDLDVNTRIEVYKYFAGAGDEALHFKASLDRFTINKGLDARALRTLKTIAGINLLDFEADSVSKSTNPELLHLIYSLKPLWVEFTGRSCLTVSLNRSDDSERLNFFAQWIRNFMHGEGCEGPTDSQVDTIVKELDSHNK